MRVSASDAPDNEDGRVFTPSMTERAFERDVLAAQKRAPDSALYARSRMDYLGLARETTIGVPIAPDTLARWFWLANTPPEPDGTYRFPQRVTEEAWWLETQRWLAEQVCAAFAIPADYFTEERRNALDLALDEVRDRIEKRLGD